jgi:hypothetical protein
MSHPSHALHASHTRARTHHSVRLDVPAVASVARCLARLLGRYPRRNDDVGADERTESACAAPTALGEAARTAARAAPVAVQGPTEADAVRVEGSVARAVAEEHDALVVAAAAKHTRVDTRHIAPTLAVWWKGGFSFHSESGTTSRRSSLQVFCGCLPVSKSSGFSRLSLQVFHAAHCPVLHSEVKDVKQKRTAKASSVSRFSVAVS